ncbi:hypothetical protein MLD38_016015 [Melastoma candidum]|uniref:Uncharacterized protein n=1 Tax=Melastoma candidum TaxID=119954 RepID=A0ACB9RJX6_9MYRT|nr:hypothetical protein MLD38_016015 [Melastoma candidum]
MASCTSVAFARSWKGNSGISCEKIGLENGLGKARFLKLLERRNGASSGVGIRKVECSVNSHSTNPCSGTIISLVVVVPRVYEMFVLVISIMKPKIKVIGVGGGGSNAVNRMIESGVKGVEFWMVNMDVQVMRMLPVLPNNRLQICLELTRGLGAGGNPETGMNAAKESRDSIEEAI